MNNRPSTRQSISLLALPSIAIIAFVCAPLILIVVTSLTTLAPDGSVAGYGFENYKRFATSIFVYQTGFSIGLALLVSIASLILAVPFTFVMIGFSRRVRTLWLIYFLAQMSLSEVLIGFGWQIILSRTTGISNLLVWIGLMDKPVSFVPSFTAVLIGLVYSSLPYAVLVLFPVFSRLDRSLVEAARTLGASPLRAFADVVLPSSRAGLIATGITVYVLTLGSIIIPQLLGKPAHWTLSIHVTDQALFQFNPPYASALAIVLLASSVALMVALRIQFRGKS